MSSERKQEQDTFLTTEVRTTLLVFLFPDFCRSGSCMLFRKQRSVYAVPKEQVQGHVDVCTDQDAVINRLYRLR